MGFWRRLKRFFERRDTEDTPDWFPPDSIRFHADPATVIAVGIFLNVFAYVFARHRRPADVILLGILTAAVAYLIIKGSQQSDRADAESREALDQDENDMLP
jgi:hypothetical protein